MLVMAGLIIGLAAHAQTLTGTIQIPGANGATRQLIKPADSSSITATAGPSIVIPALPSNVCTATNGNCVPAAVVDMPIQAGSYCGWAAADPSTEGGSYSNYPCQGHRVAFMVTGTVFADCPAGYQSITTGVNGSAIWYSCLKL